MGLRINTNIQALSAQRSLGENYRLQNQSLERMSSGTRIVRAGDDAAGLAISEKMKASIRSLKQATRNANDGIGMIQTAEGAMNEVSNIMVRMRELSIQASSDTVGDQERGYINKEVQQLKTEVDRIAHTTEFNGHKLIDGSSDLLEFQIGMNNDAKNDRIVYDPAMQNVTLDALHVTDLSTVNKQASQENLEKLDFAINKLNENRSGLGALQNRLQSTINNLSYYVENMSAANSRIRDTDMAEESTNLVRQNILSQANVAVLGQANSNPQLALKLLQ